MHIDWTFGCGNRRAPEIEYNSGGVPHEPIHEATVRVSWHRSPFTQVEFVGKGIHQKKKTAVANGCIEVIRQYQAKIHEWELK
jgi:hypothetical protein